MKRTIIAVALAVLAVPAMAQSSERSLGSAAPAKQMQPKRGLPFEQTQLDRGFLADTANGASSPSAGASNAARGTTYEQTQIDRGVPPYTLPHEHGAKDSVWSKDYNFIAPPL